VPGTVKRVHFHTTFEIIVRYSLVSMTPLSALVRSSSDAMVNQSFAGAAGMPPGRVGEVTVPPPAIGLDTRDASERATCATRAAFALISKCISSLRPE